MDLDLSRRDLLKLGGVAAAASAGGTILDLGGAKPHVRNFGPNIGHDYGGRLMAAWLDR